MVINSIGFIGGGRIVRIMLAAWQKAGMTFDRIVASDSDPTVRQRLTNEFPVVEAVADNVQPASCDIIFIALHPPAAKTALPEIKTSLNPKSVLVSLAPVLTASKLEILLGGFGRIVRMIPNAPSIIGKGYNPVWFSSTITSEEKQRLMGLFEPLGEMPEVSEENLEAYAVLSAMGPTYFWFQIYQLIELGQSFGLEREAATEAVSKMLCGAAGTVYKGNFTQEQVLDLIPVKPLSESESEIGKIYREKLTALYQKIKPAG